jgi:tetratricopeptide repeat protein 21B
MIRCKIFEGQIEDAEQQVEFVKTVEDTMGRTSEMAFIEG